MAGAEIFIFLLLLIVVVVMMILIMSSVSIIQPYQVGLLLVMGMYKRKLDPGINMVPPLISRVEIIDIRTKQYIIPIRNLRTGDKRTINRDVIVYAKVVDPVKAHFELADHEAHIRSISESIIKQEMGKIKYREIDFD